jgi:ABC-type xylose transport system permease subunit
MTLTRQDVLGVVGLIFVFAGVVGATILAFVPQDPHKWEIPAFSCLIVGSAIGFALGLSSWRSGPAKIAVLLPVVLWIGLAVVLWAASDVARPHTPIDPTSVPAAADTGDGPTATVEGRSPNAKPVGDDAPE